MSVHDRLAEIRKDNDLTQTEFAERMGVSRRAYVNYERGEREIPSSLLLLLHDELSISPTWVLTGKGRKTAGIESELTEDAVVAVRTFSMLKKLEIEPEREAKLVILLLDYFKQDRDTDPEFVQKLLESAT